MQKYERVFHCHDRGLTSYERTFTIFRFIFKPVDIKVKIYYE